MNAGRIFGALFLASGAALLVHVVGKISLGAALGAGVAMVSAVGCWVWYRADAKERIRLRQLLKVGLVTGVCATIVYDVSRFALIIITGTAFWPFDIFEIFGRGIVGPDHYGWWVSLIGFGYHVLNGIAFGTAYTIWFGRRGPLAGVGFALMLELFMVSIYPTWLNIAMIGEFLSVSIFGHIAYGLTLGYMGQRLSNSWLTTAALEKNI
ncbi:MAG TPA: hypothetical protein VJI96_05060 [Candidatus Andersenbacteria bacterium]|nr:hypothetical protein [Candidatus Andersenbacteria bacterium]